MTTQNQRVRNIFKANYAPLWLNDWLLLGTAEKKKKKQTAGRVLKEPYCDLHVITFKHVLQEKNRKCFVKYSRKKTNTAFSFTISTSFYKQEHSCLVALFCAQNSWNKYWNACRTAMLLFSQVTCKFQKARPHKLR